MRRTYLYKFVGGSMDGQTREFKHAGGTHFVVPLPQKLTADAFIAGTYPLRENRSPQRNELYKRSLVFKTDEGGDVVLDADGLRVIDHVLYTFEKVEELSR